MSQFESAREERYRAVLEPGRLLRWIYLARIGLATANFGTSLLVVFGAEPMDTVIATVVFVTSMALTAYSFVRTEVNQRATTPGFLYLQFVHDVVLITAVVHVTGGSESPISALYILANAAAALMLPIGSSLLIATLGVVMYTGDAVLVSGGDLSATLGLQLVVFALAAVGTGYIAARLQEAGVGRERLRAELASMQLRAADILSTIRAGIMTVDDDGRLLYANRAASELLGTALDTAIGSHVLEPVRSAAPGVADAIRMHIAERRLINRTEGVLLRNGRAVPLGITTTAVRGDLSEAGGATTVIFQDISDEKRVEALRLRAQRLEAVAELSASLAHEIKNPLASIRSAVEQMSRRPAANADERTLGDLIVRETDRLSRLLSEFLDFARVQVVRRDRIDLRRVAEGAAALAAAHPDRAGQGELRLDMPDEPALIEGDEDLLHRAIFNLVLNAMQVTPEGGTVSVSLRVLQPSEQRSGLPFHGPALELEVADSGSGIPLEVQDRLFEPFATTKPGGSGLGLAIVHRAIEAHRGVILVDTESTGTRFSVLLPAAPDESGASAPSGADS
ncbi:MAG TPA: ATP-binding protein [Gemmatimonadaceae bacterium]|nr:ATP-binding protein [Gemmatimonadaceae bacterium]